MKSSESVSNLSAALNKAQAEFRAVGKSGENKYDKYRYADLEDYVGAVRPILAKHGLSLISSVEDVVALEDRQTKNGGCEHAVRVKLTMRILHESGEWIEGCSWGEGQDRADKSVYKAVTGARKYGLASALGLATSDDPERDEGVGHNGDHKPQARQQPPREAMNRQTGEVSNGEAKLIQLLDLVQATGTPDSWIEAACKRAGVKTLQEMPADKIELCIKSLAKRSQKKEAASASV